MENLTYPRAKQVVVPSRGLVRELQAEFPYITDKLTVLPNTINLTRLQKPPEFDRQAFRHNLGIDISQGRHFCIQIRDKLPAVLCPQFKGSFALSVQIKAEVSWYQ
jgi:hypothetical protein